MPTLHGINSNVIYPQPGFTVTQDQNGGWSATRDYSMRSETWNNSSLQNLFARGVSIELIDNTLPSFWSFLTVSEKRIAHEEGGIITVSATFNGTPGIQFGEEGLSEEALPTYRLEGRLMELPLSEHPKWKALSADEQYSLGNYLEGRVLYGKPDEAATEKKIFWPELNNVYFSNEQIASADGIKFRNLITDGVKTFTMPTVTYTETTTGDEPIPPAQLNKLGKISNPRGNPPTVAGSYNWMLTGASQEQRGEIYQTTFEWTMSGASGWDDFLYE